MTFRLLPTRLCCPAASSHTTQQAVHERTQHTLAQPCSLPPTCSLAASALPKGAYSGTALSLKLAASACSSTLLEAMSWA